MPGDTKANLPVLLFENQPAWEAWIQLHYADSDGIWLKMAKKGSGIATISYNEALEIALCFGWIDSQIAAYDQQFYLHKFSPRRSKSKWSKMNREMAETLIATGRMHPPGLQQVELAKADGRWEAAYDPQSQITIPPDLQLALDKNQQAKDFFAALNSINRYAILHRIQTAKKPETRASRIQKFVEMLAKRQKIYP